MSESLDTLLRFERGELSSAEAERVRRRLIRDSEARVWLEWIAALRSAVAAGSKPGAADELGPDPIEIAALAEGTLPPTQAEAVRAALARTPDGYELLATALEEVRALAAETPTPSASPGAPGGWSTRHWFAAAAMTAAAALVLLVALELGGTERGLHPKRDPLRVATLRGPDGGALAGGLEAYRAGDWGLAAEELATAVEVDATDGRAWLYMGSALLLAGRDGEAAEALERAVALANGTYADEARMQLAQVCIALGKFERAEELLRELAAGAGHRALEARAQLEEF